MSDRHAHRDIGRLKQLQGKHDLTSPLSLRFANARRRCQVRGQKYLAIHEVVEGFSKLSKRFSRKRSRDARDLLGVHDVRCIQQNVVTP